MDTKQFLSTVLGGEGYYCVAGKKNEGSMNQKFHDSLDSAAETARNFDEEGHDVYFGVASFVDKNRKAGNVRDLKCLFLDIDCGTDKPYQTQAEALKALRAFRKTYVLPRPYIINSGRGLHVYWTLDKPYSRDEWEPVAKTLKATCLQDGLEIDAGVTADAARLLRVPDTRNFKGEQPLPVAVVLEGESGVALTTFISKLPAELIPVPSINSSSKEDLEDMERAKGVSKYKYRFENLIAKTKQGEGCAHIARAILEPDELTYPEWLHTLSIAKRCDTDGVEEGTTPAVHLISKRAANYDPEETRKISESIEYPHTCGRFDEDHPGLCDNCTHKDKIKSPITLCGERRVAEPNEEGFYEEVEAPEQIVEVLEDGKDEQDEDVPAPPPVPTYPSTYMRPESQRGVINRTVNQDTNQVDDEIIYRHDLFLSKILHDPAVGLSYEITHINNFNITKRFMASQKDLTSAEKFRDLMNEQGIILLSGKGAKGAGKVQRYIAEWMQQLQDTTPHPPSVKTQFGWTKNCKSFVLGDKEIFKGYEKENPAGVRTAQYIPMFAKQGTLEKWKEAARFYNKEGFEQHQYMFGLSFGAPLMEFVSGIAGAIYNLNSPETGIGKTTGMWGGASVWGDHKKLVLIGKDTPNSAWNRAEIIKNLPLYIDEISNYEPKDASDFCFGISDGAQRNRMTSGAENAERYRGEQWAFSCGTTGNSSITDTASRWRSSPKGESGRVVSHLATKLLFGAGDTLKANDLNDTLAENYGWAGEIYIKHVINTLEATKNLVLDTRARIVKDINGEPSDRFWIAQGATTYAGCLIAKELGLIDWDLDNLYKWIIRTILAQKHDLEEMDMDIEDLVGEFYMDNTRNILRILSTQDNRGSDLSDTLPPDQKDLPLLKLVARHETDTNQLFIRPQPFREWCAKHKYVYKAVIDLMRVHMEARTNVKKRMVKGTSMDSGLDKKKKSLSTHVIRCQLGNDPMAQEEDNDEVESD